MHSECISDESMGTDFGVGMGVILYIQLLRPTSIKSISKLKITQSSEKVHLKDQKSRPQNFTGHNVPCSGSTRYRREVRQE